jgi:hypothetical protein
MSDAEEHPGAARASEDALAVGTIIGARYRVERQIGEVGVATVFLAEEIKHHRPINTDSVPQEALVHESLAWFDR